MSLQKFSPTKLAAWAECPRRFRLQYIDRIRTTGGPWAHLDVANAVHNALRDWCNLPDTSRGPVRVYELVDRHWTSRAFKDDDHSARWRARAQGWCFDYTSRAADETLPGQVRATEASLEVAVPDRGVILTGRADRIDTRTDDRIDGGPRTHLVVVDYKVGRTPPTHADAAASRAGPIYTLAAGRRYGVRADRFELHHLPTGTVAGVDYASTQIGAAIVGTCDTADEARAAVDTLHSLSPDEQCTAADDLFPADPGPLCASCAFRHACPAGVAAAPAAASWQYLPEDA